MSIQNAVCKTNTEDNRIYIEDYVATYLKQLKQEADLLPIRVALFGHTFKKEDRSYFFVYGAACVTREYHSGKNVEMIQKEFFEEHDIIGYVNIYGNRNGTQEKSQYSLFYESNEAMQNYLIYIHKQQMKQEMNRTTSACPRENDGLVTILKNFLLSCMVVTLALAINFINEYTLMTEFMQTTVYLWHITD